MRLLLTGSRDWTGVYAEARIQQILNVLLALCDVLGTKLTIVHGACPTGADRIVDNWAVRREHDGVTVERHHAQWALFRNAAGPRRNQEMVDAGANMCIGFLRNNSIGTRNCLALARNAKIPTFTVNWEEGTP